MSERAAKRARQACENCRRKKSKCPGERPVCSYCFRLGQHCEYADEYGPSIHSINTEETPETELPRKRVEARLEMLESVMAEVLGGMRQEHGLIPGETTSVVRERPAYVFQGRVDQGITLPPSLTGLGALPPSNTIVAAAELYLLYCDCQPLPLFHRNTFMSTVLKRDPEILFSILALTVRFSDDPHFASDPDGSGYAEAARKLVMQRVSEGPIELSTLQSLCILSLVDFTNGNTQRASIHGSLAMDLAHSAGLRSERQAHLSEVSREERRRCFWSVFLIKRLHVANLSVLEFSGEDDFPSYPESTGKPSPSSLGSARSEQPLRGGPPPDGQNDAGIVAYAIQLSEVWFKTTKYGRRRGKPSKILPWSSQSEYTTIMAQQMDFETRMPYVHRFKPADFSSKSPQELHQNRDYWGPWLFIQFVYHTNLCLLNHPLLFSLRLRNFTTVIPEIFIQHTADLISSHSSWILHYIDMVEEKAFKISDPFIAHCVAIVATIQLQESFKEGNSIRDEKQFNFAKCLKFIRDIGQQWPHVARIGEKLQRLAETVSVAYQRSNRPPTPSRGLLIDLGQFWEILEYPSSSEVSSSRLLFGPSLYHERNIEADEVGSTSALPEPTRLTSTSVVATPLEHVSSDRQDTSAADASTIPSTSMAGLTFPPEQTPFAYTNDELAVLAESFFHQRSGNLVGPVDDWWNTGNL